MLDLFSGIGGFHKGFEQAGFTFDYVGFSEIDKYASAVYKYNYPNAEELGDVKLIRSENLPKIDLITFGSPCQDFSIAGLRSGMQGDRSSLISEAIRLIDECRPRFFVWENVKGTFSSNGGADFWGIVQAFINLGGYRFEWELLNSRWFQVPQNRERLYFVGISGKERGLKVFPIGKDDQITNRKSRYDTKQSQSSQNGYTRTITNRTHKMGCEDSYIQVIDKQGKKKNNQTYAASGANSGGNHSDMDLIQTVSNASEREHGFKNVSPALLSRDYKDPKLVKTKVADYRIDEGLRIRKDNIAPTLTSSKNSETQVSSMSPFVWDVQPVLTPDRAKTRQDGRRFKENGEPMFTLTSQDQHGVKFNYSQKSINKTLEKENLDKSDIKALDLYNHKAQDIAPTLTEPHHNSLRLYERSQIRRLTPVECMRLQGFPDNWNERGIINDQVVKISDTQRYKQAGNAVTVNVVEAVARKLKP